MNRKVFVIVIMICLVMSFGFAEKGDIRVGVQVGYGSDDSIIKSDSQESCITNGGLKLNLMGEYGLAEDLYLKMELGVDLMDETTVSITGDSTSGSVKTYDNPGPNFLAYVGAEYKFDIGKRFDILLGAGVDFALGKQLMTDSVEPAANGRLGVGAEAGAAFDITEDIHIFAGFKYAIYFLNTNTKDKGSVGWMLKNARDSGYKTSQMLYTGIAGVTYSL